MTSPVSMDQQVQKAVDCYNAGATVLHVHVSRGGWARAQSASRRSTSSSAGCASQYRRCCCKSAARFPLRRRARGKAAKWPGIDTRHMLAELSPQPDQVTIVINTNQMSLTELMSKDDYRRHEPREARNTSTPTRKMVTEAPPSFFCRASEAAYREAHPAAFHDWEHSPA